jgi:Leucine-rich repeat (LRR) protein
MLYAKVILFLPLLSDAYDVNITGFHSWKSETGPEKPHFLCPDTCYTREEHDRCCSCEGKPIWELNPNISYLPVYVEYMNSFGRSRLLTNNSTASLHWLSHENGRMNRLPDNLCEYNDTLVTINLKGNKLQSIEGINCLWLLDFLDLSDTLIVSVSNETFSDMPNLRVLIMMNTNIRVLEPNTFTTEGTEIFVTDLSNNDIDSFDISNVVFKRRAYCNITVTDCNITFTEANGVSLSMEEPYGGGEVIFANSIINKHPIQMIFGKSMTDLKNIFRYDFTGRFTYQNLDTPCDCNLAQLVLAEEDLFTKFHYLPADAGNYTCSSPAHMKNLNVLDVFYNSSLLDLFVCPKSKFCPTSCTCIEQPSHYRMIVDCSNQNLTRLPPYLPETIYNIELNCSNNLITNVHQVNYLEKVSVLDLSGNQITEISDTVPTRLQTIEKLSLTDHSLLKLFHGFSNIDAGKVWFGLNPVPCSCDEKWIRAWRLGSKVNSSNPLMCRTESGVLRAEEAFDICEDEKMYIEFLTLFALPALVLVAYLMFRLLRFDFIIFKNRINIGRKSKEYRYDIFFLFDDSSEDATRFALGIYSHLRQQGYECFVPQIDGDVGEVIEIQLYRNIKESRSIVTILSMPKDDDVTDDVMIGMKHAWSVFSSKDIENIIAVVFDGKFSEQKARFPYLGALKRANRVFKMTSRKYDVKQKVEEALPPPSYKKQRLAFLLDISS